MFYVCFTPYKPIQDFREKMDGLHDNFILVGDFNARAFEWDMPDTDTRGKHILEKAARRCQSNANRLSLQEA